MSAPRWTVALIRRLARPDRTEDVIGDLEEGHARRRQHHRPLTAKLLTSLDALDMAAALIRERFIGGTMGARMSLLDFKLGVRMLSKYPGLTLVGGLAIALAIAIGALVFEFGNQFIHPTLPLEGGDRIVALRLWHLPSNGVEEQALHDFVAWRDQFESVEELGAYRDEVERNLVTPNGQAAPVKVAEITASAFRLAPVRPLLGRPLVAADERAGAAPVIVIGERIWQARFAGDPTVIGKTVHIGQSQSTVVGVMPESFAFPVNHGVWVPLRINSIKYGRRQGPPIRVFGRLAPGISLDQAQAELTLLGQRASEEFPDTHEHLRPQIMPYARSIFPVSWSMVTRIAYSGNLFVVIFLALVCANVATLVFARTATRETEIVVRNALGASRGRILMQLFTETLVLGGFAALVGLATASLGMRWGMDLIENTLGRPFWLSANLSPATVLYAVGLTVLGAVIAGVVPALKVTRGLAERIRHAAVGGTSLRFGRLWTGLIVTQVALTVFFMTLTFDLAWDAARARNLKTGFPAEQYLSVKLTTDYDRDTPIGAAAENEAEKARFRTTLQELERRVAAEPAVAGVTYANPLPGTYHDWQRVEADGSMVMPKSGAGHQVVVASVATNYFDALSVPIRSGRGFHSGDLESGARVVIVNQTFARQVLGGVDPIGRRVRFVDNPDAPGEWLEIVGLVPDVGMTNDPDLLGIGVGGLYHPLRPGDQYSVRMALHVQGDPEKFARRFRNLATAVDPSLRLDDLLPMEDVGYAELRIYDFSFRVALLASAIVLLLSVSGVYSIFAFTVSRRTREIGIRTALGADPRRIILGIFSRALTQVGLGVLVATVAMVAMMGGFRSERGAILTLVPPAVMLVVCVLACIVPTRRALRIQPTEALKADA